MNLKQSINRSFNLLAAAIVGLSGFAFMAEIFLEHDWDDKIDDIILLALAIIIIVWYLRKDNRYNRSVLPVVLTGLALATKIMALIVEFSDPEAAGDDFGAVILFVLAFIFILYEFHATRKLLNAAEV